MQRMWRLVLVLIVTVGSAACARAIDYYGYDSGYANDSYASQIGYDSFNASVRKRMTSARIGSFTRTFGSAPMLRSDDAYAMAPASRTSNIAGYSNRRQLDCVYYNGFNIWGDFYQTWAKQNTKDGSDGYTYRASAPAIGFDWSSGGFTVGVASTYNWGKLKSRDFHNDRKVRSWALELYGQYDSNLWYANATVGYGYNSFRSTREIVGWGNSDKYHSNSWNFDAEFGMKLNLGNFRIEPNVGIRYFHDRRGSISERGANYVLHAESKNYHVLEMPVGVNVSYEMNAGGMIIVPQLRGAWIPELSRKRGGVDGRYFVDGVAYNYSEKSARRNRHGFLLGAGIEARLTKSLSAHIDYNLNFRSKAHEHRWDIGLGYTF